MHSLIASSMRVMVEDHQKAIARFRQQADTTARRTDRPTGTAGTRSG